MKRYLVSLMLFLVASLTLLPMTLYAQSAGLTSHYAPGNVALGVNAGFYPYRNGFGLSGYPYAEIMFAKYRVANYLPLDFGLEGMGRIQTDFGTYGGLALGVGGFGTLHVGFIGVQGPAGKVLSGLDFELGLGLAFDFINTIGYSFYTNTGFGFASLVAVNYFFTPAFALSLGETYWRGAYDTTIGVRLKFGSSKEALKKLKG